MQKLWQWIRDKKSNTMRKWRSSVFFGSRRAESDFNPFDDNYFRSDRLSVNNLEKRPIGGSDSGLERRSQKRRLEKLQQKLAQKRATDNHSRGDNEIRQLLLDDEDIYNSRSSINTSLENGGPSSSPQSERTAQLPPINRPRGYSYSQIRSPPTPDLNRSELNSPTTPKTRRRLRFVIPQVSLSSVENPNVETTLLVGTSQDSLDDIPENQHHDSNLSLLAAEGYNKSILHSPGSARRSLDHERRRISMAQRRQSTNQLVSSVSGRRTSTTLIPLTVAQIHLVKSLWKQIYTTKGPTVIGETVMHRLFFKCPKLKDQFRRCALPENFPNHDNFAKFHHKCIGDLVDQVVENLDDLEVVGDELERIGRIHAGILNGQLSSKIWNSVAETFIDCTLEWGDRRCRSETVRKAWALIIAYMIEKLRHGHLDQRKQMLTMKTTIASLERLALSHSSNS